MTTIIIFYYNIKSNIVISNGPSLEIGNHKNDPN